MNAVLHENPLERYEVIYSGKRDFEVSGETVVPDKMPDIGMLGEVTGQVMLRTKHVESGRCYMKGTLHASISFIPDGAAGLRVLNMELPWETEFSDDSITQDGIAAGDVRTVQLDARMLNPRKILLKAALIADAVVYEKRDGVIYDRAEDNTVIQVCEKSMECSVISTVCEKSFAATDEYPLPVGMSGCEILGKTVQFRVEDVKTLTNKLIVKGTVISDVMLCGQEGESEKVSFTTGFSFIAETDQEQVSEDVSICIIPTAMYYETASDGRVLSMEVHGLCQMIVYERKTVSYLSDAYSNFYPCACEWGALQVYSERKTATMRETVSGSIACRGEIARVLFLMTGNPVSDSDGTGQLSARVGAYVRYENGMLDWVKVQASVPLKRKETDRVTSVRIVDLHGSGSGSELEYRMTLEYELQEESVCSVQYLTAVTYDEECPTEQDRPSLMVVRARDSLWELARKYGSTVSMIKQFNGIEEDEPEHNTVLLIPRQRK